MLIPVYKLTHPGACKSKGRANARVVSYALVDDSDGPVLSLHFWTARKDGYAQTSVRGKNILMHHMVVGRVIGCDVSHENANPLDNRRSNLRHCSRSDNVLNPSDRLRVNRKSCPFRGVSRDRKPLSKPWRGKVTVLGVIHQTKRFATAEEASLALAELRKALRVREFPKAP